MRARSLENNKLDILNNVHQINTNKKKPNTRMTKLNKKLSTWQLKS